MKRNKRIVIVSLKHTMLGKQEETAEIVSTMMITGIL